MTDHATADRHTAVVRRPESTGTGEEPTSVQGYEILRRLGRGGMGVVYLARDRHLGRLVALKMISGGGEAEPELLLRFQTEARAVAALQHPGIVQLYECGEWNGLPYFTLEYLAGGSLAARIHDKTLAARDAAQLVLALAEAMAYAHEHGIVHRDLKPDNIFLTSDDVPKVGDFGLARQLAIPGVTGPREILGTPDYMAPEQARGDTARVGPGADIWALGAILYRLVSGRAPFQASTGLDTLRLVLDTEPVPLRQLAPSCPRDLETITLKCLQKHVSRRYVSARALADDLARFLNGEPIRARPVGTLERAVKWVRRNPVVTALGSLSLLTLLVGMVVANLLAAQADRRRVAAESAEASARTARDELANLLECNREQLFSANLSRLVATVDVAPSDALNRLLDPILFPPTRRDPAWGALFHASLRGRMTLSGDAKVARLALHPGGHFLAQGGGRRLELRSLPSGNTSKVLTVRSEVHAVQFTHAGESLVTLDGRQLVVYDVATGRELSRRTLGGVVTAVTVLAQDHEAIANGPGGTWSVSLRDPGAPPRHLNFPTELAFAASPDGTYLASSQNDGTLVLRNRTTGEQHRFNSSLISGAQVLRRLTFDPLSQALFCGYASGHITRRDMASLREFLVVAPRGLRRGVHALTVNTHLTEIAVAHDGETVLYDVLSGQERLAIQGTVGPTPLPVPLAFRLDGEQLLFLDHLHRPTLFDHAPGLPGASSNFAGHLRPLRIADDQRTLLLLDDTGATWRYDTETGDRLGEGPRFPAGIAHFTLAPRTGLLVATTRGLNRTRLHVLDANTGRTCYELPHSEGNLSTSTVSADGTLVVLAERAGADGEVRCFDGPTGRPLGRVSLPDAHPTALSCRSDGRVSVGFHDGTIRAYDASTGSPWGQPLLGVGRVERLHERPDGSLLALHRNQTLTVWNFDTGCATVQMDDRRQRLGMTAVSGDGRTAASYGPDGIVRLWDLRGGSLRASWQFGHPAGERAGHEIRPSLLWSDDGQRLIVGAFSPPRTGIRVLEMPYRNLPSVSGDEKLPDDFFMGADASRRVARALRRRLVTLSAALPFQFDLVEDLIRADVEAGEPDRAALRLARQLWLQHGIR